MLLLPCTRVCNRCRSAVAYCRVARETRDFIGPAFVLQSLTKKKDVATAGGSFWIPVKFSNCCRCRTFSGSFYLSFLIFWRCLMLWRKNENGATNSTWFWSVCRMVTRWRRVIVAYFINNWVKMKNWSDSARHRRGRQPLGRPGDAKRPEPLLGLFYGLSLELTVFFLSEAVSSLDRVSVF